MLKSFSLVLLLAASSTVALAQNHQNSRGTDREQEACTRDVTRHCRKLMGESDFVILRCLQDNRKKLSRSCLKVLEAHGQ